MQKTWNVAANARNPCAWLLTALALTLGGCTAKIEGTLPAPPEAAYPDQLSCQPGLLSCNGLCVNVQGDSNNCGTCGSVCAAPSVCESGKCGSVCAAGFQQCGASCANLQTDAAHCGSCDKVCNAGTPCFGGACGCPEGALSCQGQCFDPRSDAQHCGSCDKACSDGAACIDGNCACAPGEQLCDAQCSSLNQPEHCGSCDKACAAGEICAVNSCIPATSPCPGTLVRCGNACVDLQTTTSSCGACDNKCTGGQACSAGTCGCAGGKTACGSTCADLSASPLNCGACGNKCTGGLPCTDGVCVCPTGEALCNGMCVRTDSTAAHCGGCGMACPVGESCEAGKCSGAIGDSCTSNLATGISLTEISVYQAGKVPVMEDGEAVAKDDRPADVIQGKSGRVRAFIHLESGWAPRTVSARLLLTNNGVKSNYFSKKNPTQDSAENSFGSTFNFDVKGEDFTADTHYAVEIVECDGTPGGTMGKPRFPTSDRQELVTRQTGPIKIKFVPLNANGRTASTDQARIDLYKNYLNLIYPTSGVEITVGSPLKVSSTISESGSGWSAALDQLSALHQSEDATADTYYYGLLQPTDTFAQFCIDKCTTGLGFIPGTQSSARHQHAALGVSFGTESSAQTLAHELGHNHGRPHSPCGGASSPDPNYPYAGAKIGWWGYQAPEKLHDPATVMDIMSYCKPKWVSDYVYRKWTDRIAFLNGAMREVPPPGGMHHYLFLLTDMHEVRWGVDRPDPIYPAGEPEAADILDEIGNVIASVTVYRTPMDHVSGALYMVPDPEPGWHAIQLKGEAPLAFGATTSSH